MCKASRTRWTRSRAKLCPMTIERNLAYAYSLQVGYLIFGTSSQTSTHLTLFGLPDQWGMLPLRRALPMRPRFQSLLCHPPPAPQRDYNLT